MAGPTGLGLFRTSPAEFRKLVRRRLVAAGAQDRPFARCAALAEKLGASAREKSALGAPAALFQEWEAGGQSSYSLEDFGLSIAPVNELYERAWPWLRGDPGRLIQASLLPPTAVHPREPTRPAMGRGLPDRASWHRAVSFGPGQAQVTFSSGSSFSTYTSTDGYNWREVPRSRADHAERCSGSSSSYSAQVGLDAVSRTPQVRTFRGKLLISETPVVPSGEIVATSCDDRGLLLLVRRGKEQRLGLCLYQERCRELALPTLGTGLSLEKYPLDIARANGTTVVAVTMGALVRVASTRNDGVSWTPFSVAFDALEWGQGGGPETLPNHLLALGAKVTLYAGFRQMGAVYPVLVSEDFGASFRGARESKH
ncbi:MAG: hypothetical protein SFV15_01620 [Polyangiaceae bacterium]|nr:hypothetical protein [Polyangiaceae bacterium]